MTRPALLILLGLAAAQPVTAQPPKKEPTPNDTLVSPQAHPDKKVTFRIYAPRASEVTLRGDWLTGPAVKLEKDDKGVWATTVGPLPPDYYSYSFTVDGVRTLDPKNATIKQGLTSLDNMFFLGGPEADFQDVKPVPHGDVRRAWYESTTLGGQRRLHVYTPPGYDASTDKYPVLYLLHGAGDEDSGWSTVGRAGFILDNLIAARKAKPMLVVMPNGSLPRPAGGAPKRRALAGLSMGGGQTTRVLIRHPDQFAYVAIWSAGLFGGNADAFEKQNEAFFQDAEKVNKSVKHLAVTVGDKDFALTGSKALAGLLEKHKIKHELRITGGGHTWINWRQYLNELAPRLFQ
jgi:enterochelin esterase-like enzyme